MAVNINGFTIIQFVMYQSQFLIIYIHVSDDTSYLVYDPPRTVGPVGLTDDSHCQSLSTLHETNDVQKTSKQELHLMCINMDVKNMHRLFVPTVILTRVYY